MWGVVARIAAAAVVVAAVQHHASQIYEAWRSEQPEEHQETKFFPKRPDDLTTGVGVRDDTRARTDRAGADSANGSGRGASGPSGGHRTYATVAVGAVSSASSASMTHRNGGPRAFPFSFAFASAARASNPTAGFADARSVALGLRAARRVAR